jgi:hypothetical protein
MQTIFKILTAVGLVAIGFGAGAKVSSELCPSPPVAQVTFKNESGQAISSLKLNTTTAGQNSTILLPSLQNGKSTNIRFFLLGEGSYQVTATLADGRVVEGGAGYVESGDKATKRIRVEGISE